MRSALDYTHGLDVADTYELVSAVVLALVTGGTVDRLITRAMDRRKAKAEAAGLEASAEVTVASVSKITAETDVVEAQALTIHVSNWKEIVEAYKAREAKAELQIADMSRKIDAQDEKIDGLEQTVAAMEIINQTQARQLDAKDTQISRLEELTRELLDRVPRTTTRMTRETVVTSTTDLPRPPPESRTPVEASLEVTPPSGSSVRHGPKV